MPAGLIASGTEPDGSRPTLHLSGPRLTRAFETLVKRAEPQGGVERYIAGLAFKTSVFQEALSPGRMAALDESSFLGLCAFIAPVRRRVGVWFAEAGIGRVQDLLKALLDGADDTATADDRIAAFCAAFPDGREYRWTRDLATDTLHAVLPEQYPLMSRWVWDHAANTGVLREIWHGENVDHMKIDIPDGYATFLMLREELSQFLSDNGVFRDMLHYVDLLCAQVYADYICEQGGSFLRTDFASEHDPMQYTRRMLGLDGIDPDTGRTRTRDGGGRPVVLQALPTRH